jgi:hypothetical protein
MFHNKQSTSTPKGKPQWGDEQKKKSSCRYGEGCRFVNSDQGCRDYHPDEHIVCRWDDKCIKQGCRNTHPSRAEGLNATSKATEHKKQYSERTERPVYKKTTQDTLVDTTSQIKDLEEKLAALKQSQVITDFKNKQRIELEQFMGQQAAALAEFMKKH